MTIRHVVTRGYGVSGKTGTLYVPGDVDEDDDSSNAASGTLGTQAAQQTTTKKFGAGSIEFSPSGSSNPSEAYLEFSDIAAYALGTDPFTIECWVRIKDFTSTVQVFASQYTNSGDERGWWLRTNGNTLEFEASNDGVGVDIQLSGAHTWSTDTWYHVAATRDEDDDFRIFVDGTQVDTTNSTDTIFDSAAPIRLGKLRSTGDQEMDGFIDDFRLIQGECLYKGAFTVPAAAHTVGFAGIIGLVVTRGYNFDIIAGGGGHAGNNPLLVSPGRLMTR